MRLIKIIYLMLIIVEVSAQTTQIPKFTGSIQTGWQSIDTSTFLAKRDTPKFADGIRASIGVAVVASNGLTKTGNNVALGGVLTTPTTIQTGITNTLAITGLQGGATGDSIVTIANGGKLSGATPTQVVQRGIVNGLDLITVLGTLRIPRLNSTERGALNGGAGSVTGDVIYNTTEGYFQMGNAFGTWDNLIPQYKTSNVSLDIPLISGLTTGSVDVNVTNATIGNSVTVNPRSNIALDHNVTIGYAYVPINNVVRITFVGHSLGTNGNVNRSFDIKVDKN